MYLVFGIITLNFKRCMFTYIRSIILQCSKCEDNEMRSKNLFDPYTFPYP